MAWINLNSRVTLMIILFLALIARGITEAMINRTAKISTDVVLICDASNYTQPRSARWVNELQTEERTVAFCIEGKKCSLSDTQDSDRFQVEGNSTVSKFTVNYAVTGYKKFRCWSGMDIIQSYNIMFIDPTNIKPPKCHISPITSDITKRILIKYSCQSAFSSPLPYLHLESGDVGYKFRKLTRTNTSVIGVADYRAFPPSGNISCELSILGTDISKSCPYPDLVNASYDTDDENEENDVIIKCEFGLQDVIVSWGLIGSDEGDLEDIQNRSWTQNGGRSLLLQDITSQDNGKVVECKASSDGNQTIINAIGYSLIVADVSSSNKTKHSEESPPYIPGSIYLVLTLLFLALWLITCAVGGICLFCREMKPTEPEISSTSRDASVPNYQLNESSNAGSNVNRDSGQRDTSFVNIRIGARGNPDTSNTNNSANNLTFELEADTTEENKLSRQSNSESHLYFTLEQSSPSNKSLQRASIFRRDRHGDTNPVLLNQPQSSASYCQGYEIVGESNKGATCPYDLGEYAEVGDHIIGRGPPIIRQKPGREEVKEDDMSRLYSKVKK